MPPPNTLGETVRWLRPYKAIGFRSASCSQNWSPAPSPARRNELVDQLVLLYDGTMISAQLDPRSKPHRSLKAAVARLLEDPTAG